MDIFCKRLQTALKDNNMTSIELANKLNINRGIISNYINGKYKPKMNRLTQIAKILKVKEAWLMGYDDNELNSEGLCEEIEKLVNRSSIDDIDKKKIIDDVRYICLR